MSDGVKRVSITLQEALPLAGIRTRNSPLKEVTVSRSTRAIVRLTGFEPALNSF
jgi:hypothetical protein